MSDPRAKALERMLARLERRQGTGKRRFPKSSITLVLGLLLGQQLLSRLVPMVWQAVDVERLGPALGPTARAIATASVFCQKRPGDVTAAIVGVGLASLVVGYVSPWARRLLWVASVVVLLTNGLIVLNVFQTSAMVAGNGLDPTFAR